MSEETPAMDYPEHEKTYAGFIEMTKLGTIATLTIMVTLCLFAFGGGGGVVFGWILLVMTLAASTIGMLALKSSKWIPNGVVFGLSLLAALTFLT